MALFTIIPDELLLEVVKDLQSKKDLRALALTSKRFTAIAQAAIMPTIELRNPSSARQIFELVRTLLDRPDLASNVTSLDLAVPSVYRASYEEGLALEAKVDRFRYSIGVKGVEFSWAGLLIALVPFLKHLKVSYSYPKVPLPYVNGHIANKASILDALFANFTSDDLHHFPGLKSVTDVTIRGDAGDLRDWMLATLPKLRHLEIPGTKQLWMLNDKIETQLSSVHLRCSSHVLQSSGHHLNYNVFTGFKSLTRLQLTLSDIMIDAPVLTSYPVTSRPTFAPGSFANMMKKLEPLATTLQELDINLDLRACSGWLKSIGPMTSLDKYTQLKRLRLPQEALVSMQEHLYHDTIPASVEEIEIFRATRASTTWTAALLGQATYLKSFKKLSLDFLPDQFRNIQAWYWSTSVDRKPALRRSENGVDVKCRVERR
ncbi:hypothetical protein CC80DRAFT_560354 [Byssothecium circinans]|uniref:F-box domain-containing protein n=1 Tax=Byssothecium circinans TaxID=147558 RepID=A0A6A5U528_9PLEO|nr:hypothetical protein CC80DRAFT_560354 [Byssothecium circinans]